MHFASASASSTPETSVARGQPKYHVHRIGGRTATNGGEEGGGVDLPGGEGEEKEKEEGKEDKNERGWTDGRVCVQ